MSKGFAVYDRAFPGLEWTRDKSHEVKIYVLVDPRDNTVRYVGQTRDPHQRRYAHQGPRSLTNWAIADWKMSLNKVGKVPLMAVVDSAPAECAHVAEAEWMAYYLKTGMLTNQVTTSFCTSPEHIRLLAVWRPGSPRALSAQDSWKRVLWKQWRAGSERKRSKEDEEGRLAIGRYCPAKKLGPVEAEAAYRAWNYEGVGIGTIARQLNATTGAVLKAIKSEKLKAIAKHRGKVAAHG